MIDPLSNGQLYSCVLYCSDSLGVLPPITAPLHLPLPRTLPLHSIIADIANPTHDCDLQIHNFDSLDPLHYNSITGIAVNNTLSQIVTLQ